MTALLMACGGFLAGVLWMDLLFDVQIMRMPAEEAVAVISAYYANATTRAYPMNRLIGLTMLTLAGGAIWQLVRGEVDRRLAAAATATAMLPVGLALTRIVPNAVHIGERADSLEQQAALARSILVDHLACLALIVGFIVIQANIASRSRRPH
jgi:hypothetical protein